VASASATVASPVPTRRRRGLTGARLPLALAAVILAVAALGGWLLGQSSGSEKKNADDQLGAGAVSLTPPSGWQTANPASRLGALPLDNAVSAGQADGGTLDAGTVSGTLPARVADRVARKPGKPGAVRLGDLEAYVWRDVVERGSRSRLTLFAAATDSGLVALACRGPADARARCERAAGSLTVQGTPLPLADLDGWARRLDRITTQLNRERRSGRSKLRRASSAGGATSAAKGLASDYTTAARSLAAEDAPTGAESAQRSIETTLRDLAADYRRLASASKNQKRSRYRSARRSIRRHESALKRELRRL
jgi:hypothetical protein